MEAGSYYRAPQDCHRFTSTLRRSARPTAVELHCPRKYSQGPEGADATSSPVCTSGAGNLLQLETPRNSPSNYARCTPESSLDCLSLVNECIEKGRREDESCSDDAMESAFQVDLNVESAVGARTAHREILVYGAAPSRHETSWRHQLGRMQWNTAVRPLTARDVPATHATNLPLRAEKSRTAASFHQGCPDRRGASQRHYCEPRRLEKLLGHEECVLSDNEDWSQILPEDWVRRRRAWLLRQRLLEGMWCRKAVNLNEMILLLHARHDDEALHLAFEQKREEKAIAKAVDIVQWLANVQPPDVVDKEEQAPAGSADVEAGFLPIPPPRLRRSKKASVADSGLKQQPSQHSICQRQASWSKVLPWLEASFPPDIANDCRSRDE